jgi:hypothetical protein
MGVQPDERPDRHAVHAGGLHGLIFGRRPADALGPVERKIGVGFANRPFDNVGVQYGLQALLSGEITPEDFVSLNEQVGGLDIDWNNIPQRSVADPAALTVAYRAGLVSSLQQEHSVPVIDLRGPDNEEIHTVFHSYVERARLDATGGHGNQIIWIGGADLQPDPQATTDAVTLLDQWLSAIEADHSDVPLPVKVVRDKPAGAVDACWIRGHEITDQGVCRAAFPYFEDPRIAAAGPWTDNVLKCQLKPLNRADYYGVTFTDQQWQRLEQVFPTGACDYSKPPVGWAPTVPWMSFADGSGGRPLGPPPTSTNFP